MDPAFAPVNPTDQDGITDALRQGQALVEHGQDLVDSERHGPRGRYVVNRMGDRRRVASLTGEVEGSKVMVLRGGHVGLPIRKATGGLMGRHPAGPGSPG